MHRLLQFFEEAAWAGAPRYLGIDESGREILGYLDGHVAWAADQQPAVRSVSSLLRVAQLVRQFHDLTAGSELAGGEEVVCHNDLAPRNTIYRDEGNGLRPIAFIDWDLAGPGRRVHDVAHVCWQYVDLGPGVGDVGEAASLIRVICDGYGLADRSELIPTILWWQDRCWRGIAAGADTGDPAMIRLRGDGSIDQVRAAFSWTYEHRDELDIS